MQPMYFGAWGKHFLLTGELGQARMMFERQAAACTPAPVDNEARTQAQIGLAHVALDENCPRDAVTYGTRALESLDPLTAPTARAKVLVVIASAQRALGNYEAAYAAIEESNQLRLRARPMAGAWNSAYKTLTKTVDDLKVIQAQLLAQTQTYEFLSTTDDLTQLPNRRKFDSQFTVESARAQRNDQELVIVIFDIDHFKRVNDTYGHPAGDAVLQSVAKVVQTELRPGDLLARVGGEEFALLLPQTALAQGALIAERIRKALAGASISRDGRTIHVTASFGVAQVTASNAPFADTLERADAALYRAKHSGRNQVCCEQ
jgi:diguanylate cyclase (GGDEF)-like protein